MRLVLSRTDSKAGLAPGFDGWPGLRPAMTMERVERGSGQSLVALLHLVRIQIYAAAHFLELGAHLGHAVFDLA